MHQTELPEHAGARRDRRGRAADDAGGKDAGPNPWTFVWALATSEISYKAFATVMGIEVKSVACSVGGELDLRGFLGVDESVPKGFTAIKGTVTVDAPDISRAARPAQGRRGRPLPHVRFPIWHMHADVRCQTQAPTDATRGDGSQNAQAIRELGATLGMTRPPPVHLQSVLKTRERPRVFTHLPEYAAPRPLRDGQTSAMPGSRSLAEPHGLVWVR